MRRLAFVVTLADGSHAVVAVPRLTKHEAMVLQQFPKGGSCDADRYARRANELAETFMPPKRGR